MSVFVRFDENILNTRPAMYIYKKNYSFLHMDSYTAQEIK